MAGDIRAKISLDTSELAAGTARAENLVRDFKHGAMDQFKEIGKGMVAAFAIEGVIEMVKNSIESLASIQETATNFNTTAESVQRLSEVADNAGGNFKDMAKALSNAASLAVAAGKGNQDASDAFEALGINAKHFLTLDLEDRGREIARAIEGMTDKTKAHDLAMELLGKKGMVAYGALSQGVQQYEDTMNSAFVVGDESVAQMKELKESLETFTKALVPIGAAVAKTFLAIGNTISSVIVGIGASIAIVYNFITGDWARALQLSDNLANNNKNTFQKWLDIVLELGKGFGLITREKSKVEPKVNAGEDNKAVKSGEGQDEDAGLTPKQKAAKDKAKKEADELKKITQENEKTKRDEWMKSQSLNVQKMTLQNDMANTNIQAVKDYNVDPLAYQQDVKKYNEQKAQVAEIDKQIKEGNEKKKKDADELAEKHKANIQKGKQLDIEASGQSKDKKLEDEKSLVQSQLNERVSAFKKERDPKKKEDIESEKLSLRERLINIGKEQEERAKKAKEDKKKATEENLKNGLTDGIASMKTEQDGLKKSLSPSIEVDALRRIGGGAAGVNYHAGKDNGPAERQISLLEKQVRAAELSLKELEKANRSAAGSGDGSF